MSEGGERHKYILLELRLPSCKPAGSFGDPAPPFAPGEIRIQAISQAAQKTLGGSSLGQRTSL